MSPRETFPPALPLDGAELLTVASWMGDPLVQGGVAFSLLALMLAFLAAWSYAKFPAKPRYRRTKRDGDVSSGGASPFSNLLGR